MIIKLLSRFSVMTAYCIKLRTFFYLRAVNNLQLTLIWLAMEHRVDHSKGAGVINNHQVKLIIFCGTFLCRRKEYNPNRTHPTRPTNPPHPSSPAHPKSHPPNLNPHFQISPLSPETSREPENLCCTSHLVSLH